MSAVDTVEPTTVALTAPDRTRKLRTLTLAVVAVVVLATGIGWALAQRGDRDDQRSIERARADAVATTLDVVPQLLTYDPATLDADIARARAELTPRFEPQFEELQNELITPTVGKGKVLTTATVQRVAVTSATVSKVTLLVFLEQATTKNGDKAAPIDTRAVVTLALVDGRWLVDDLKPV